MLMWTCGRLARAVLLVWTCGRLARAVLAGVDMWEAC